jgi:DNA repair exonuclease SbcCD ATPase subunit
MKMNGLSKAVLNLGLAALTTALFKALINLLSSSSERRKSNRRLTTFLVGSAFFSCVIISGCSPEKKVEAAKEKIADAKGDLKDAQKEAMNEANEELRKFKLNTEERITANEKRIAELKVETAKASSKMRSKYNEQLAELEKNNNDLRQKFIERKDDNADKWNSFKSEFSSDMDKLGESLKNFTMDNKHN